jgi:hypothetical protein
MRFVKDGSYYFGVVWGLAARKFEVCLKFFPYTFSGSCLYAVNHFAEQT